MSDTQSMRLKYKPSSEPLHISASEESFLKPKHVACRYGLNEIALCFRARLSRHLYKVTYPTTSFRL